MSLINAKPGHRGFYTVPLTDRFWAKVRKRPDGCWEWLGNRHPQGYGHISINGRTKRAHRVAWELHNKRQFPAGMLACHTCDNPCCVNPAHIWPGSARDNLRDMASKGRSSGQQKTHCKRGHPLDADNTYVNPKGQRSCRACRRDAKLRSIRRLTEARA